VHDNQLPSERNFAPCGFYVDAGRLVRRGKLSMCVYVPPSVLWLPMIIIFPADAAKLGDLGTCDEGVPTECFADVI